MPTGTFKIILAEHAHYVTQSHVYDNPRLGLLTDKRLDYYERERLKRRGVILPTTPLKPKKVKKSAQAQPKPIAKYKQLVADLLK